MENKKNPVKVALSASHGGYAEVILKIAEADVIYTTQIHNRDALYEMFGKRKVRFIPDSSIDMLDFIKSRYEPGTEFLTYIDIFEMRTKIEERRGTEDPL